MIDFCDAAPRVDVLPAEYQRLLGYPPAHELDEHALELCAMARTWFAEHGRPWVYARRTDRIEITTSSVRIDDVELVSDRLQKTFTEADACTAVLVAASAGPELEVEANQRWKDEKPDEYFFLEAYGSAVVEYLITTTGARLCASAEQDAMAVLPHYSPGYPGWDIREQALVLELVRSAGEPPLPGPVEVLDSGMLRPKKSLLAVFGVTRETDRVRKLADLIPCERCSLPNCQYRRRSYARSKMRTLLEL
jgi:hypothetical protein